MPLGELELAVLSLLRERGEMTHSDIHAELLKSRRIAYTSVTTTVYRLERKGLVRARRAEGRKVFFHLDPSSKAGRTEVREVLGRLVDAFGEASVSHALEDVGRSDEEERRGLAAEAEGRRKSRPRPRGR